MWNDGGRIWYAPFVVPIQRWAHSTLSNVVRRSLSAARIPSMLEPSGLDRDDGKRPDAITVYPYSRGRCLIWDAACVFQPVVVETSGAMGKSTITFLRILVAVLPCDFRVTARAISCSRECLWLFSGGTLSAFGSRSILVVAYMVVVVA